MSKRDGITPFLLVAFPRIPKTFYNRIDILAAYRRPWALQTLKVLYGRERDNYDDFVRDSHTRDGITTKRLSFSMLRKSAAEETHRNIFPSL